MDILQNRLETFKTYPLTYPSVSELAKYGFYYHGVADVCVCFNCKVVVGNWEKNDDPLTEHYKYSKNCSFLKKFVNNDSDVNIVNEKNLDEKTVIICSICNIYERNCLFTPCNHVVSCMNCADKLSICSICRVSIEHKIKIYIS